LSHRVDNRPGNPDLEKENTMNRILIATILGLATAVGASAMTSPTTLSNVAKSRAEHILPNASFANLTAKQVVRIEGLLSGGQDLTDSEFRQRLETALAS